MVNALLLLALLLSPAAAQDLMPITLPDGKIWLAEVMATPSEHEHGLMFRDTLPEGRLMVFTYDDDGNRPIWMKDCRFPIDVAWLDADGKVLAVMSRLPPCKKEPCPIYDPGVDFRNFVEGAAGWTRAHKVAVGQRITLGDPGR